MKPPLQGEHRRPPFWCWPFFAFVVAPWRQHGRGKLAGRCSLVLVLAMFLACSWQVLSQLPWKARCKSWGQCWRSFWQVGLPRFLHGDCFQVVPPNGAKMGLRRWAKLGPRPGQDGPRWGQNRAKRGQKSRPKAIQSRSRMLIALKRPRRASRGATVRNFRRVLGGILATNREPNAAFGEHVQPKVACWRQKSLVAKCIRKKESENIAKMIPRGSKKESCWRSFGQLCPPKAP